MMINVTTPALLFPAISLLLLAYTNRFLTIANLLRSLKDKYTDTRSAMVLQQIKQLRYRVNLIRGMQLMGSLSFFFCVVTMLLIFIDQALLGEWVFGFSLVLLLLSLALSVMEIHISVNAINSELSELEKDLRSKRRKVKALQK
ncbi:DUF2721 domain-containing protein [Pelagibaculum spongiae]|uniref:DUF2721 domain-containing protein n=1 Tax=Pelagibaculum spongiae TaxID=2080658 RepID=A0A2V1GVX7_9GAMM|nr:DUF2721 domain-containing protein [Pelagibaculum spongiae]PVZ70478.1 DUF2721 domain-containing protein [Pelagibaculum spongiae]